jgi:hypothetical protein
VGASARCASSPCPNSRRPARTRYKPGGVCSMHECVLKRQATHVRKTGCMRCERPTHGT